jgi:hypothetical protein
MQLGGGLSFRPTCDGGRERGWKGREFNGRRRFDIGRSCCFRTVGKLERVRLGGADRPLHPSPRTPPTSVLPVLPHICESRLPLGVHFVPRAVVLPARGHVGQNVVRLLRLVEVRLRLSQLSRAGATQLVGVVAERLSHVTLLDLGGRGELAHLHGRGGS